MIKFTLLNNDQVFGYDKSAIFKKYGTRAAATDFAILEGAIVSSSRYVQDIDIVKLRSGRWYVKDRETSLPLPVLKRGFPEEVNTKWHQVGFRPVTSYSEIKDYAIDNGENIFGVKEVLFGEYPSSIETYDVEELLEKDYQNNLLATKDSGFTINQAIIKDEEEIFSPLKLPRISHNNDEYVRMTGNYNNAGSSLSDKRVIHSKKNYWTLIEPIIWLVDEEKDIAITKDILFNSIPYEQNIPFEDTTIYKFLNDNFAKEINHQEVYEKIKSYKPRQKTRFR